MKKRLIKKVLVANRGEIAARVMRGCRSMEMKSVAVYSDIDAQALHVRLADEAYYIGKAPSSESYLRGEKIIEVALQCGADAIHPGYGFLSENAEFARLVKASGLIWIGPPPAAIEAMGSKTESRTRMMAAGVPVVPGNAEALNSVEEALSLAEEMGYPVMLKAAAGGGGKGMREVATPQDLPEALRAAKSEAQSSFGDDSVYMEKRIVRPRHVEVQILADTHGNVIHLFERDCSIQRRHQKVVEEAPCPIIKPEVRAAMTTVAVNAAKAVDYEGAGTVEFLLGEDQSFYFLEMNTRLQVEHPITEQITGVDLVCEQLRVAMGEPLSIQQEDLQILGHAMEFRIYAEDSWNGWAPSPGVLSVYSAPEGPWVRIDSGVAELDEVTIYYDPMIAKLVVWGRNRQEVIQRSKRVLSEFQIAGITTTIPFFMAVLQDEDFVSSNIDTGYITSEKLESLKPEVQQQKEDLMAHVAAAVFQLQKDSSKTAGHSGQRRSLWKDSGRVGKGIWH